MATVAPFGSWASPITPAALTEGSVTIGQLSVDGADLYWNESRPGEGGRLVIVRRSPDGRTVDVLPAGYSARTRVHEYGGLSYAVRDGVIWFSNFVDQRVYRVDPGGEPVPVTPEGMRFADFSLTPDGKWLIAVRETHGVEVVNDIAAIPAEGGGLIPVIGGHDFFAAPRPSPDGRQIAWVSWDFPNMPWDGTELFVAALGDDLRVGTPRRVAGGRHESVSQPRWSPAGRLHFISDRTGWWNLYTDDGADGLAVAPLDAEFAGPDWTLGQSSYAFLADGTLVTAWRAGGQSHLGTVRDGSAQEIEVAYTDVSGLKATGEGVVLVAGSPTQFPALVHVTLPQGRIDVLQHTRPNRLDPASISVARAIEFPTERGKTAHAYFYRPVNAAWAGPEGELPPLIVMSHGGPTSQANATLNLGVQYWTSRGFAVVDVDYGGSTGYGREYRDRLRGNWGIVDVEDCVNATRWLVGNGEVDSGRIVIRGGSAGGYTTLAALAFTDVFAAGASLYGVADAAALARDTHKFESRYLDNLIGPWPEAEAVYRERSPIDHVDSLNCPLVLFQGLEDRIVPPNQSEMMRDALSAKGLYVEYHAYEGEQHGFRQAGTIMDVARKELAFYGKVLGFTPAVD